MERQRGRRGRKHLAADREDAVDVPHALLEIATLDGGHRRDQEIAHRVAREPVDAGHAILGSVAGSRYREAVLEQVLHQGLRVGEGHDAVADVADGRDPELVAQDAGRAAVIGDGDDRGQVARAFLEATQQDREARPAADRHDARPAGQGSALVHQLDERLARVGGRAADR